MGVLHKYICCALSVIIGLTFAYGYDSQTNMKVDILERKMDTVILELQYVKAELEVEKEKSLTLENKLNELLDGKQVTTYNDKGKGIIRGRS